MNSITPSRRPPSWIVSLDETLAEDKKLYRQALDKAAEAQASVHEAFRLFTQNRNTDAFVR